MAEERYSRASGTAQMHLKLLSLSHQLMSLTIEVSHISKLSISWGWGVGSNHHECSAEPAGMPFPS